MSESRTPNEHLAEQITQRLVAAKLISSAKAEEMLTKLANGLVMPADWRFYVETMQVQGKHDE